MPTFAQFSILTGSRHPRSTRDAYDSDQHQYHPDYVAAKSHTLGLSFDPPAAELFPGTLGIGDIPAHVWTVTEIGGPFTETIKRPRSTVPTKHLPIRRRLSSRVAVPGPGWYNVKLQVDLGDGNHDTSSRNYRLRDFLVVGIGDSFASGQGNPDVPAVRSLDEQMLCKVTTIAIALSKSKAILDEFVRGVDAKAKDIIELLPFAGQIVVGTLSGAQDVRRWIHDRVNDVKGLLPSPRDIEGVIVEGIEEVGGWLGIGDGGEATEISPRPAAWQEPFAYRSYLSGQSLAARVAEGGTHFGDDRITFLAFGRTGSEVDRGLLGPRTTNQLLGANDVSIDGRVKDRGQVAEARDTVADRRIDALVISIGINDLGFSSLVEHAILKASGEKRKNRVQGAMNRVATEYPASLDRLKAAIDTQLNPRHVFLTEYPVNVFKEIAEGASPCGILASSLPNPATGLDFEGLNLDGPDARDFTEVGRLLNAKIREKAREFGWVLVDGIERGFDGHGYCAKESFFVSAEESCLRQGDFEGMLHPNRKGHEVTSDCIATALQRTMLRAPSIEPVMHVMMV